MLIKYMPLVFVLSFFIYISPAVAQAQDSTIINKEDDFVQLTDPKEEVTATFKTTRIANGHTVELCKTGVLDVRINHRFGRINEGVNSFFGLDNAVTRIGFDYGVTDYLMAGVGRSTLNKEYDGFVKLKLLKQRKTKIPVTVSYLAGVYIVSEKYAIKDLAFFNRVTYLHQLLVARKFSDKLSLQVMPTLLHFNATSVASEENTIVAFGFGGRYKISKRAALTVEYHFVPEKFKRENNFDPLTIGIDIETGGHVFQMFFSNASGISERSLFTSTTSQWSKGQLHFGFNISRVFTVKGKKKA